MDDDRLYAKYAAYHLDRQTGELGHELEGFYFVLRPDRDRAARVALAAYAAAVQDQKPQLSSDLWLLLEEYYREY